MARFEAFLEEVWANRKQSGVFSAWYQSGEEPINQPLLQIHHKRRGKSIDYRVRTANYVGIIRFEGHTFHLMPKLFKHVGGNEKALKYSNAHLLWWLSYNKWLSLPKHVTSLSLQKCDFLEILMHLFATYTLHQLQRGVYQTYQEVEGETTYLKGQLLFNEYTTHYLGRANYQKMYCKYDSFEVDNALNRIIKFVARQLRTKTTVPETRNRLANIVNLLGEARDVPITHHHCSRVVLNRLFGHYQMVLDYCEMFLSGNQTTTTKSEANAFAFLVPMERVFEEFVLGFIQKELKEVVEVQGQYQKKYLTTSGQYALRPDLFIEPYHSKKAFIADCKYKLIYDGGKSIAQSDLYQMLAYAIRHKVSEIKLFYPKWADIQEPQELFIKDEFTDELQVRVQAYLLDMVQPNLSIHLRIPISSQFTSLKEKLISRFKMIFEATETTPNC